MTGEECSICPFMVWEQYYGVTHGVTDNLQRSGIMLYTDTAYPFCRKQNKWCASISYCTIGRDIAATKRNVLAYVEHMEDIMDEPPIYEIVLYARDGTELDEYKFPDRGVEVRPAFYHYLDTAIKAMHDNWGDMREYTYSCGFVYAKFPGMYPDGDKRTRIFFRWNDNCKGFYEAEEPANWEHYSL